MYQTNDDTEKGCILAMLAILTFGAFVYYAYSTYMHCGFFPKNNPTAEGTIVKSSIEKSEFERRGYSIEVIYEYMVHNQNYKSNTICCGSTANEFTKDIINKYPVGSKVTVYYREKAPNLSIIEPSIGRAQLVTLLTFGFLFISIFSYNFYHARKN